MITTAMVEKALGLTMLCLEQPSKFPHAKTPPKRLPRHASICGCVK